MTHAAKAKQPVLLRSMGWCWRMPEESVLHAEGVDSPELFFQVFPRHSGAGTNAK